MLKFIRKLKYYYNAYKREAGIIYNIIEIDDDKNLIRLQLRGKRTILKHNIDNLINDYFIINCFCSEEACAFGVYCGVKGHSSSANDNKVNIVSPFKRTNFRYFLVGEERGKYLFIDAILKKQHYEEPLSIAQNKFLINNFSPDQAFHIGIMAGKKYNKLKNKKDVRKYKYNKCFKLVK